MQTTTNIKCHVIILCFKSKETLSNFAMAMSELAELRAPIDAFFDSVQVNADNQTVRRNRLNLLHRITQTCRAVADLTRIEG